MQQEYDFKMSTRRTRKWLLYVSLLLDVAMLTQALIAINMVVNAQVAPCDDWENRLLVSTISGLTIMRVSHLIGMAFFFICCFPCYFCNDSCCLKRWLVKDGGAPRQVVEGLELAWSWTFAPGGTIRVSKDPAKDDLVYMGGTAGNHAKAMHDPTHCPVCFIQFERGQRVTYLPCQLNRVSELVNSQGSSRHLNARSQSYLGSQASKTQSCQSHNETEIEGLISYQSKDGNLDKQHLFH